LHLPGLPRRRRLHWRQAQDEPRLQDHALFQRQPLRRQRRAEGAGHDQPGVRVLDEPFGRLLRPTSWLAIGVGRATLDSYGLARGEVEAMRWLRGWTIRVAGLFGWRRAAGQDEIAAELESHLQMHIEDNLRAGMSPAEARRQARLRLGGVESTALAW